MTTKEKMNSNKETAELEDVKINTKIVLAILWAAHFLLWTFGDMLSLLQKLHEPADNNLLLFVAAPLAIIQALMIFFSLKGKAKVMRMVNIIMASVFAVFNVGYLVDAHLGWEYLLGVGYLLVNGLIIGTAWKWPKKEV